MRPAAIFESGPELLVRKLASICYYSDGHIVYTLIEQRANKMVPV